MTSWIYCIVSWIVALWAVGFAACVVFVGVALYIDQEIGLTAFREWATRRLWRDLAMWCFHPVFVVDMIFAGLLMGLVWTFRVWRANRRLRRGYRTPW